MSTIAEIQIDNELNLLSLPKHHLYNVHHNLSDITIELNPLCLPKNQVKYLPSFNIT